MSSLHTITKGPDVNLLSSCASLLQSGDAILFLEDGVYHCAARDELVDSVGKVALYCLKEDLRARGVMGKIDTAIKAIDYAEFVELCTQHDRVVSWF